MKKQQATEYMYASARISALENHLVGRERMQILLDAKNREEVLAKLGEFGEIYRLPNTVDSSDGQAAAQAVEDMLLSVLATAYREVGEAVPDMAVFRHFKYPYDCNNIKAILKCQIRGVSPDDMLFDFGSVSVDALKVAMQEGKYDMLPEAMAQGVAEAKETYAKTSDPQLIDAILDRACYRDMLVSATASGSQALLSWVKAKIDLVNIMICLRIIRMKRGDVGQRFMREALITGGYLEESFFMSVYESGEDALWSGLSAGKYHAFVKAVESSNRSLAAIEKCADDHYMQLVKEDARVPFGPEVLGGYLMGVETAVKNIRIILAAKDAGLAPDVIRERIRESYV